MGRIFASVEFPGHAPPLVDICAAITRVCSMPVAVIESNSDDLRDLDATIAFECAKESTLDLLVYRPGAAATFCDESFDDAANTSLMKSVVQGANEPAGAQTVYLRGVLGQERTLFVTTVLALETLGGRPANPIADEERREFARPVSETELLKRQRAMDRDIVMIVLIAFLLLPVLVVAWLAGALWAIFSIPLHVWRDWRASNQSHSRNA